MIPGFATIKQVENLGADRISEGLKDHLEEDA
jgi:hypothetical protein